ncbi:ABC transporter substrate-binding protein [Myxococcota bacterium]
MQEAIMRWLAIACGWVFGITGCGSDATGNSDSVRPVEVFFLLTPLSATALDELTAVYQQQHPGGEITKTTGTSDFTDQILSRFEDGAPPDLFQTMGGRYLCGWVTSSQSYVENLDALAAEHHWTDVTVMPQVVQDSVRCTGPDGDQHFYGVPMVVNRANTLFHNRKIFAEADIAAPPASIDEFFQVADTLKQRMPEITPFALGTAPMAGGPWALGAVLFEGIAAGMHGTDWYVKFFSGRADLSNNATEDWSKLRAVLEAGARLLDYVNPNLDEIGLGGVLEMLRLDQAAMTITGDWPNGVDLTTGWSINDSCDGQSAFGPMYGLSVDVFALSKGAKNRAGAMDFLSSAATREGQDAYALVVGGIPPEITTLDSRYNEYARGAAADFAVAGDQLVFVNVPMRPEAFATPVLAELSSFQTDKNVDALMLTIRNNYGRLKE